MRDNIIRSYYILLFVILLSASLTAASDSTSQICTTTLLLCGDGTNNCNKVTCQNITSNFSYVDMSKYNNISNLTSGDLFMINDSILKPIPSNFRLWLGDNFVWEFHVEKNLKNQIGWWLSARIFPIKYEWIE